MKRLLFSALASLALLSCGIEDYVYLAPVGEGNIRLELNSKATINLPSSNTNYFTHFVIYYRIYISNQTSAGSIQMTDAELRKINPSLAGDYSAFFPYTQSNTTVNNSIGTQFANRHYYPLELEGADIDSILGSGALSTTITLDFPVTGVNPALTAGGRSYVLNRSTGDGSFRPLPDLYFLNTSDLYASANVSATINADTVDNTGIPAAPRYTYAAMYIVVSGIDSNYSPIFSAPTFIGIFSLSNKS